MKGNFTYNILHQIIIKCLHPKAIYNRVNIKNTLLLQNSKDDEPATNSGCIFDNF